MCARPTNKWQNSNKTYIYQLLNPFMTVTLLVDKFCWNFQECFITIPNRLETNLVFVSWFVCPFVIVTSGRYFKVPGHVGTWHVTRASDSPVLSMYTSRKYPGMQEKTRLGFQGQAAELFKIQNKKNPLFLFLNFLISHQCAFPPFF